MKTFFKRFLIFLLIAFLVIQFFRTQKNVSAAVAVNDIAVKYKIPADVHAVLKASCYDCHSNNTRYPWYNNIQPIAWYLADHVKEAKKELNFNEFASYKVAKQYRKLEEIINEVEMDEMPIESYTLIHGGTRLNLAQKTMIIQWATVLRDTIKANYPEDSLVRKPQAPQIVNTK
ncbi:MAG: heme-binding domain-containing protein [Ferruginibacter sp.]|nr:heme-binding domain-containing protein [Ferruginibacter sp.]